MARKKFTSASGTGSPKKKSQLGAEQQAAAGGELHQNAGGQHLALTTNQGVPLSDNQNSLKANPRGPALLEDFILREKITHFDHERIPERIVHARATGVHGFFELTSSLKKYTTARILTEVGEKTPTFTRISTVAGGAGSVDTSSGRARFCGKVLHQGRKLGPGREQHTGVLYPGRHQISRPNPCRKNGARPGFSPIGNRTRYVLGFHFTYA
jgi:Catalase